MRDVRRLQERVDLRLDRTQVIWLTFGFTLLLGVSFTLGLFTGRRAERRLHAAELRAKADPIEAIEENSSKYDTLTFYRELKEDAPQRPASESVAVRSAPEAKPERDDNPSPKESSRPASALEVRGDDRPPEKQPDADDGDESDDSYVAIRHKLNNGPAALGQYTVQVSAFQDRDEASAFASSLERKGFQPFITEASLPEKGTWYRVRLGAFENEFEATVAKQLLARDDIPAWVLETQ